jgi:deoxyribodipyrimidine photo-lyase
MSPVPEIRIRSANKAPVRPSGKYVLYWMIANRRLRYNFALDRALERCHELRKPLLIFEALRVDYPWASDRMHRFVIDGMADSAKACAEHDVPYFPYVEPHPGAGKGLLAAFAEDACVVVTDEYPCFFLPAMVASAAKKLPVLLEAVDSNGLLPLRATHRDALRAFDFRRTLQKELPKYLLQFPAARPFQNHKVPAGHDISTKILEKWKPGSEELLNGSSDSLSHLPIDHSVKPTALRGGSEAGSERMHGFLKNHLGRYGEARNDPDDDVTSCLSPYLHFGHLSAHELFAQVAKHEKWHHEKLSLRPTGKREGFWHMSTAAEEFIDQAITWRELGYNFCAYRSDYERYESLPNWAQETLRKHGKDEREHVYNLEQFETAATSDPLWNAAQTQIVREGRIHNYLRMLWGKKILEWSRTPQQALEMMIHLNNKYGIDGRDPNSYSGIFWILGRYDRPWPERAIFGTIRYMSSTNTARKVSVTNYLKKFGQTGDEGSRNLRLF